MRLGRTFGLLALFAGTTAWFATRAALRHQAELRRLETQERLRWETDGGATTAGPQPLGETTRDRPDDLEAGSRARDTDSPLAFGR
jgi:hypothetical protein